MGGRGANCLWVQANFVMGKAESGQAGRVFLVDFGLAKQHLDERGQVLPPRSRTDFRGTIPYASLSAHFKCELGRKDDLWSFFFILLEMLGETLTWRNCKCPLLTLTPA